MIAFLEAIEDVAAKIEEQERQLAQLREEMQKGVLARHPLKTVAESLGDLLREKLGRDFKQPTMSDGELGALVLLWPRQRGDVNEKDKSKWEIAFRLAREAGFEVQSAKALAMTWSRREFRRLSDDESATLREEMWRNIKNSEHRDS